MNTAPRPPSNKPTNIKLKNPFFITQIIQITNKSIQSIDGNFSDQPHSNDDDSCSTSSHILTATTSPTPHTLNNQIKSPNSTTLNGYHSYSLATNSNYAQSIDQTASVSNYRRNCSVPVAFFDPPPSGTPNRLSIHHPSADMYDPEITTCCLPPPSPAPNSDRFIGIPPQHHQQVFLFASFFLFFFFLWYSNWPNPLPPRKHKLHSPYNHQYKAHTRSLA